jgi:hypothetical protein
MLLQLQQALEIVSVCLSVCVCVFRASLIKLVLLFGAQTIVMARKSGTNPLTLDTSLHIV